jgi:hypothetical protein
MSKKDRRATSRFPVARDLRYKVKTKDGREKRAGETINISSTGLLISSQDHPMSPGMEVVVAITCPNEADAEAGMKLVARGRVVRCDAQSAAIEVEKYEFRRSWRRA